MGFFSFILTNAEGIGTVVVVIVVASLFIAGIVTERLHIGPEFRRLSARAETLETTVTKQTAELTDSLIAHATARVRIEVLEAENKRLDEAMDVLKHEMESVKAELTRIRETWNPPSTRRRQGAEQ